MKTVLYLVLGLTSIPAAGQASPPDQAPSVPKPQPMAPGPGSTDQAAKDMHAPVADVSVARLEFTKHDPIAGVHGSSAFLSPVLCSPDGIPFVPFMNPSDLGMQSVQSLNPKGGHEFSAKVATELHDVDFIHSYVVSDSMVGLLVNGTKDDKKAANTAPMGPGLPSRVVYTGEHHDFLLEFDRDGNYKRAVEFPERYQFRAIAGLADDSLLALAYDRPNSVVRLLQLDSGGQVTRTLQLPDEMQDSPELTAGRTGGMLERMNAETSLSGWHFAASRHKVLLYRAHAGSTLLEVGAGGATREVPLQTPKGYSLDGVISANDRWLMTFRREGLPEGAEIDASPSAGNYALYEVDAGDGSLKRRFTLEDGPFHSIACEQDGTLTAFSVDGDKVQLETADPAR